VAAAVAAGARIGAKAQLPAHLPTGHFVAPLVLKDTHNGMAINSQKVFNPLASVIRVADLANAIAVANGTPFGLRQLVNGFQAARAARRSSSRKSASRPAKKASAVFS
jgi:acyl-CoA reductase-like NAD-dependent aldehyde dehydrogenase